MRTVILNMFVTAALAASLPASALSSETQNGETPDASTLEQGTTAAELAIIGMGVTSSDGREVGTVSNVLTGEEGTIVALYVSVGALVGQTERQVRVDAKEFNVIGDTVFLVIPLDEVRERPDVREHAGGLSGALQHLVQL